MSNEPLEDFVMPFLGAIEVMAFGARAVTVEPAHQFMEGLSGSPHVRYSNRSDVKPLYGTGPIKTVLALGNHTGDSTYRAGEAIRTFINNIAEGN